MKRLCIALILLCAACSKKEAPPKGAQTSSRAPPQSQSSDVGDFQGKKSGEKNIDERGGLVDAANAGSIGFADASSPETVQTGSLVPPTSVSGGYGGGGTKSGFGIDGTESPTNVAGDDKVKVGSTSVMEGRIPIESVRRVVRARFSLIKNCYQKGLERNASLRGIVHTKFTIDSSGNVSEVNRAGAPFPDAQVEACVFGVFRAMAFPSPEGNRAIVTQSIPLGVE